MSTAKEIGTALAANLATITSTNGYKTDMGLRVYKGRRALDDSLIPCVVLAELPDQVADATNQHDYPCDATLRYGGACTLRPEQPKRRGARRNRGH